MSPKSVDFPNVFDLLLSYWKQLVLAIILGAIAGVSLMPTRPPVWSSSGLIRIAQIAGPPPLIDAATIAATVRQPSFVSNVLEKAGLPSDLYSDPKSALAQKTLVAIPQGSPNLIQLQVSAYSSEEAERILEAAVAALQQQTAELFNNGVQERKQKIQDAEAQLATNVAERNAVVRALKTGKLLTATQLPETVVISYLLRVNEIESTRLHGQISALQEQLNPTRTYNSTLAAPVSVVPVPQGGSKIVGGGVGALFGFVIAFALILIWTLARARHPISKLINRS